MDRRTFCGSAAAAVAGAALLGAAPEKSTQDTRPHFRAKQVLGSKVTIEDNMSVGTVDDIVIDSDGNVDYLIVANDDNKFVTIPWDAAQFNAEKRVATVQIAPAKYQKIPVYTTEQYPTFSTPAYRTQTYQYFGLTPGQERRMIRRAARNQ